MPLSSLPTPQNSPLISRQYAAASLPNGRFIVPPQQHGIISQPDTAVRVLPSGTHKMGGWLARLRGQLAQTVVATIPQHITLLISLPRGATLAAADDQLVDVAFQLALTVSQPARFYNSLVAPLGKLSEHDLQIRLAQAAQHVLDRAVRDYEAQDLNHPTVQQQLSEQLRTQLGIMISNWGVTIDTLEGLRFDEAETWEAVLERQQAFRERVRALDSAENRHLLRDKAERLATARQIERDFRIPNFARHALAQTALTAAPTDAAVATHATTADPVEQLATRVIEVGRQLWSSRSAGQLARGRAAAGLQPLEPAAVVPSPPPLLRRSGNRLFRAVFVLVGLLLIGYASTQALFTPHATLRSPAIVWPLLTGLLLPIVGLWWLSRAERQAQQQFIEQRVQQPLELLAQGDLQRADTLLKQQVERELKLAQATLFDLRKRATRAGDVATAQDFKRLETDCRQMVEQLAVAVPLQHNPQVAISAELAERIFSADEALIRDLHALRDTLHAQVATVTAGAAPSHVVTTVQPLFETFAHQLSQRGRLPIT